MTDDEHESDFELTKDTPYFILIDELWGIYCEDLGENWICYEGIPLYIRRNMQYGHQNYIWVLFLEILMTDKPQLIYEGHIDDIVQDCSNCST